jgi:diacylglycerol kinase family enzyme
VVAILNPARPAASRAAALLRAGCADRGWPVPRVLTTTVAEPGGPQAQEALEDGADRVVVGGGDGTVREVASVLARSGVPLGILPLGTANLFARNLGLPRRSVAEAVGVALAGSHRDVDLGRVRYVQRGPAGPVASAELSFLVLVGIGYDADTVAATRPALKARIGWGAYFVPGLARLNRPLLRLELERDGGPPEQHRAWSVLVGSCGRIPAGIDVIPGAAVDDGLLHVVRVAPRTVVDWVPIALTGLLHWRRDVTGLDYREVLRIRIRTPAPLTVQLDGDPHPEVTELDVRVEPRALRVCVAADASRRGRATRRSAPGARRLLP